MQKAITALMFFVLAIPLLSSCIEEETNNAPPTPPCNGDGTGNVDETFFGTWLSVTEGQYKIIDDCTKLTINTENSTSSELTIIDKTPETPDETPDKWIKKPDPANTTINLKISSPHRSNPNNDKLNDLCPEGNLGACAIYIYLNSQNGNHEHEELANLNEDVTISDVPPGDYEITAGVSNDQNNTVTVIDTVSISEQNNVLGTFNVVEKTEYNFKTTITFPEEYIYANHTEYDGTITIHNIGSTEASGLNFSFDTSDPSIESVEIGSIIGSIKPGESKPASIKISFNYIDSTSKLVQIPVSITDINGDIWKDTGYIQLYKNYSIIRVNSFRVSGTSTQVLRGALISSENQITPFHVPVFGNSLKTIYKPYIPNMSYKLVFSSPGSEFLYSAGLNEPVLINYDLQHNTQNIQTSDHEPNDTGGTAYSMIYGEKYDSYLRNGESDFYIFNMPDDPTLHQAVSIIYNAHRVDVGAHQEDIGDGNTELNRGESVYLGIGIENIGTSNSSNVTVELATSDPNVTIVNDSNIGLRTVQLMGLEIKDLEGRETTNQFYAFPNKGFTITVHPEFPVNQTEITVTMTATEADRNKTYTDTFTIPIQ